VQRMTATAEILRADRAEAILADYDQLDRMKAEAARLLAEARDACETERAKGALQGQRAGSLEARQLLDEADQAVKTLVDSLSPEIALLAVTIAERILGEFDDRERMVRCAERAIADLRADDSATLYIAPRYVGVLREGLAQRTGALVTVEPAVGMDPAGCVIHTARGSIDAGIGRQLEVVRQTVRGWAHGGQL
jgi:flagellar biosynthesis/type III secretory pathway protein FliH